MINFGHVYLTCSSVLHLFICFIFLPCIYVLSSFILHSCCLSGFVYLTLYFNFGFIYLALLLFYMWQHSSPLTLLLIIGFMSHLWTDLSLRRSLRAQLPHHRQQQQSDKRFELWCHHLSHHRKKPQNNTKRTDLPETLRVNFLSEHYLWGEKNRI